MQQSTQHSPANYKQTKLIPIHAGSQQTTPTGSKPIIDHTRIALDFSSPARPRDQFIITERAAKKIASVDPVKKVCESPHSARSKVSSKSLQPIDLRESVMER